MFARGNLSYREEMALAAAGPLFNLIFAALFFILSKFLGEYFLTLALFNLMTMFSNLAPIEGQDGYKIILALMSERSVAAERFLSRASFFTAALLSFIALYLIERLDSGYWIFALFSIYGYSFVQKSQKLAFSKNSGENKRF
ncbi:MAG: hypothetical protein IJY27_07400 [Clostridia bacterium]|nr:hypothetical protein [Clostridia bacterium]